MARGCQDHCKRMANPWQCHCKLIAKVIAHRRDDFVVDDVGDDVDYGDDENYDDDANESYDDVDADDDDADDADDFCAGAAAGSMATSWQGHGQAV